MGIRASIKLDAIGAVISGGGHVLCDWIHEQADSGARLFALTDVCAQPGLFHRQIPAVIRGKLVVTIRNQSRLGRLGRCDQFNKAWVAGVVGCGLWVAFDIEFDVRIFLPQ